MDFKAQYKDPRWQKRRLKELERANFTCEVCYNKEKTLHVHHGYYSKDLEVWADDYWLFVLCEDCHKKAHEQLDLLKCNIGLLHPKNYNSINEIINNIFHIQLTHVQI